MKHNIYHLAIIAGVCVTGLLSPVASAVSADEWRAGNIADDAIFTDTNSMSVSDIQNWLNGRISCDTNGVKTSELGGGIRAQYGASHGNPAPFTCLNNYYEVPKTTPSADLPISNYGQSTIPSGAISAAQIIYNAAQQYRISPKVLLVKLGTESPGPLTSDEWPFKTQFLYAMGAHCPDSGPGGSANCDTDYAGFSIQISEAAKLLRGYLDNMSQPWWSYKKPYRVNSILWNVIERGCGAGDVYIESKATAALYTYTPYQPNAAALNNMYGTGDSCSAYGNRNFWRVFRDWFGTTNGALFDWSINTQEIYSDSARSIPARFDMLSPNSTYFLRITAKNTGSRIWSNTGAGPVLLATNSPTNRTSVLCDSSWINCQRPALLQENTVNPGELGTFLFTIKTPSSYSSFTESYRAVSEGVAWFTDIGMVLPFTTKPPTPQWNPLSQDIYRDSAYSTRVNSSTLAADSTYYIAVRAQNTGNTTWTNSGSNPVRLATSSPQDRSSVFYDSSWLSSNRATTLTEASVAPGQIGTFEFWVSSPYAENGTVFKEYFRPVVEGQAWMNDIGMYQPFTMSSATNIWSYVSQSAYTDSFLSKPADLQNASRAATYYLVLKLKNTGGATWSNTGDSPLRLGTSNPLDRASMFYDSSWVGINRPAVLSESSVKPGDIGTLKFAIRTPSTALSSNEFFRPVIEGKSWLTDIGLYWSISVK